MPDLNKAISNRRKKLKKTYASKEWKANVKAFIAGKKCEWCGTTDKLLAHHPYLTSYSDGTYQDLFISGCMVLCNRCHFSLHKGLILCKRCGKHYHNLGADCCRGCFVELHPEIVEAKKKKAEEQKALLKKLRDEENFRKKEYKSYVKRRKKMNFTMLSYSEWRAERIKKEEAWKKEQEKNW